MNRGTTGVRAAFARYPHTARLTERRTPLPSGAVLEWEEVQPIVSAYRRQVRSLDFDVCEMAISTYLIAREHGVPLTALPIPLNRRFHHGDLQVPMDSDIREPGHLEGRRVGVRAWSVTSAVWTRGILQEQYGVDLDAVHWVVDDEENVASLSLPSNVERAPKGASLADLYSCGDLDAALGGWAGIGRQGAPDRWSETRSQDVRPLIADATREEAEWYRRSGWYPIHGVLTVTFDACRRSPELPEDLREVFTQAREDLVEKLDRPSSGDLEVERYRDLQRIVGPDPLPYGLDANAPSIEAAVKLCRDQGLLEKPVDIEEAFSGT